MKDYFAEEIEPKKDYFAEEILSAKTDYFAEEILNVTPQKTPIPEQPFSMFKETMREFPRALKETIPETARGLLETSEQVAGELSRPFIYASTIGRQIRQGGIKHIKEAIPFTGGLTRLEKSSVKKSMKDIAGLEITGKKGVAGLVEDATVFAAETGLEFYLRPEYLLGGALVGKLIGLGTTAIFKGATHLPKSLQNILFKDMKLKLRLHPQAVSEIARDLTAKKGVNPWIRRNMAKGGKYAKRAEAVKDYLHKQRMTPETAIKPTITKPIATEKAIVPVKAKPTPQVKPTGVAKAPIAKAVEKTIKKHGFKTDNSGAIIGYHGTNKPIDKFTINEQRGAFFSSSKEDAFEYGKTAERGSTQTPDYSNVRVYKVKIRPRSVGEVTYNDEGIGIEPEGYYDATVTEQAAGDLEVKNPDIIESIEQLTPTTPKPTPTKPTPTEPLAVEAIKAKAEGKSVEEFVEVIRDKKIEEPSKNYKIKGKDTIGRDIPDWRNAKVYHSTDKAGQKSISTEGYRVDLGEEQGGYYGKAISFTPNLEYTKQFGEVVTTNKISSTAKILNLNDEKDWNKYISIVSISPNPETMHQEIMDAGYDGVYDAGAGDLFIYNPKVIKYKGGVSVEKPRTVQELTDIYNKAGVEKEVKPTVIVKPKIEPIKKYKTQLTEIKGEVISAEAGYRMPVGIEKEEWIGVPSTFPEYFKNKGWTKKQVVTIIDKAQTDKKLTTKQQGILDELVGVAKEKRIDLANQMRADRDIQKSKEGVLSDKELDSIIKEPKQEEDVFKYMAKEEAGFIKIPSYQPLVNLYNRVHDWTFTFGEARRTDPELYDRLMKSYGRRNAGIERAVNIVDKVVGDKISTKDAVRLSLIYEDKRLSPQKELKLIYDKFNNLLTNLQRREIAEGIFKRPFQERMLEENEAKLEIAKGKLDYKTMRELSAENTKIKNMRYLPHNVVVQRAIEAKLAKMEGQERKVFLDKLSRVSYQFKMRKGRGFLADYIKSGLLKPEDADIRKLTAEALSSYYYRSSLKSLFDYAKSRELIKPTSEKLKMQGWLNQRQIGIVSPELKNKLIHPLLATSLTEMKSMKQGMGGGLGRRILGTIKIGQFIKPQIIWNYNAVQKYMRGIYNLNPAREAKDLAEAYKTVANKTELYHKLSESNLYQFPYEVSRASRDEQIKLMMRKTSEEIPNYVKLLERLTNTSWAKSDIDIKNTLMVAYQAMAKATWFGDKVQRTQSYLTLKNLGYPHDEAVKVASRSHGAYSILSEKYKKTLSPILFVYSFRLLMPMEIAKIVTEPVIGIAEAIFKREKIPKYKAKRWAKSLVAAIAIPVLIDTYMKARGFKKEGVHLGSLAWKWKKDIVVDGKKSEIIVGMNYILNMPIKYIQRLTYYNPIRPQNRIQQATSNLIKWEIHPLSRILFWDLKENRRSFGSGTYVYDSNAHWIKQTGQLASYVFGQSFRFWGGVMDAMSEGNLTTKEKVEQEKIFDENLSNLDRVLFSVFGYKYTRKNLPDRKAIMRRYLEKEWFKRGSTISRKYEGEIKTKQLRELEKWKVRCLKWIQTKMH